MTTPWKPFTIAIIGCLSLAVFLDFRIRKDKDQVENRPVHDLCHHEIATLRQELQVLKELSDSNRKRLDGLNAKMATLPQTWVPGPGTMTLEIPPNGSYGEFYYTNTPLGDRLIQLPGPPLLTTNKFVEGTFTITNPDLLEMDFFDGDIIIGTKYETGPGDQVMILKDGQLHWLVRDVTTGEIKFWPLNPAKRPDKAYDFVSWDEVQKRIRP